MFLDENDISYLWMQVGILWVPYSGFLGSKLFEAKRIKKNFASLMFAYLRQTWMPK